MMKIYMPTHKYTNTHVFQKKVFINRAIELMMMMKNNFCLILLLYQIWLEGLRKITHNGKANNFCPMTCLKKQ